MPKFLLEKLDFLGAFLGLFQCQNKTRCLKVHLPMDITGSSEEEDIGQAGKCPALNQQELRFNPSAIVTFVLA